jgi:alpha-ketoglutarate-dependent 2,4-dichlorophenoxyacetate dioxygenase
LALPVFPIRIAEESRLGISIRQLVPTVAGEVTGVDCREPQSPHQVAAIHAGMAEYAVLVFRDQLLTDEEQLPFTLLFGKLEDARRNTPVTFTSAPIGRCRSLVPASAISRMSTPRGAALDRQPGLAFKLADQLWHSDSSFNSIQASYSLLSGRSAVSWGGNTEFAEMRTAYDALDDRTKAKIEDIVCHSNMYSRDKLGLAEFTDEERAVFKSVRQRLLRRHALSGRKSLFLSAHAGVIGRHADPASTDAAARAQDTSIPV